MTHRAIHDANLPKPVGPYSPGMGFERLVFVSGQGATDPATGKLAGKDAAAQTEQCLENVATILRAGGSDLRYVLRCGVFLLDMKDFDEMNGCTRACSATIGRRARRFRRPGCPASGSAWRSIASRIGRE